MAKPERLDESTMVAEDKRTLARALKQARKKRRKSPGDRQIADKLEQMTGAADLMDPQRYHGS